MRERIDVRAGATIASAGGAALRTEGTTLTRRMDGEPAGARGHYAWCVHPAHLRQIRE